MLDYIHSMDVVLTSHLGPFGAGLIEGTILFLVGAIALWFLTPMRNLVPLLFKR